MKNVLIAETSNHKILLYSLLHVCPLISIFALLPGRYLGSVLNLYHMQSVTFTVVTETKEKLHPCNQLI